VDCLLELPDYPDTESAAASLLQIVHLRREETETQQHSTEKALLRCTLQLEALQSRQDKQTLVSLACKELEAHQNELAHATQSVVEAEADVGIIRVHLRRKGFSVPLPTDAALPPHLILLTHPPDTDDTSDTDSCD
jgi:hypothetical protein